MTTLPILEKNQNPTGKVVIYFRFFFLNHCSQVCNFTNIELKTKSYTHITINYMLSTFKNFLGIFT